ncbi:BRO family protein [Curtobacterium sp. MCBD17_021]|uniref:phage antirepressor n=1 Tax=Curtobacterium sp. MCBD17_021 TaxID=2175665 RepID=UPI000DA9358B|nr:BRO family protein [Curtobacterium sp. MCBD17_021]PZE66938.1 phage antirepressor protein [Curtobacterium sp. MCBD17_021]
MNAAAVVQLRFEGAPVRTVVIDGATWFVAKDACDVLGIRKYRDATQQLAADERVSTAVDTPGGTQAMTVVNEPGLYALMLLSRSGRARSFQRWVTHDVLPAIRRTGQYVAPAPEDDASLVARALQASARMLEQKDEQIAVLTPRAAAWDELADASGDYEVADAAKILARAGIETGRQRLFDQLESLGWIFRGPADKYGPGKWKARQVAVDSGYLAERPQSHHHPRTGLVVIDPPQVRVTIRGLERLRVRLGRLDAPALHAVEGTNA